MSDGIRTVDLLAKKRAGESLRDEEIRHFVQGVVSGEVQDVQLGAMLMCIVLQGMVSREIKCLTQAMVESGEKFTWPDEWKGLMVDKHSTGGVGDKISLPLAPGLAACGLKVPMISGRGLQYTGGTLDKLESIPGFQISCSKTRMREILDEVGCCIVGQTKTLVPADRILYQNRDVTATVTSIPLQCSSIISKKAAESLDSLVLDVKFGGGTFCKTKDVAERLAKAMVSVSNGLGTKTVALLTKMDDPIGKTIGNSLEVKESIECLQGKGPSDLEELVSKLGGHLLYCNGTVTSVEKGVRKIKDTLYDGSACAKFRQMLVAQGVEENLAEKLCAPNADIVGILTPSKCVECLSAVEQGYIQAMDSLTLATVACELGAGRSKVGEAVNHSVGLELLKQRGQFLRKGEDWIRIHHDGNLAKGQRARIQGTLSMAADQTEVKEESLVADVITE